MKILHNPFCLPKGQKRSTSGVRSVHVVLVIMEWGKPKFGAWYVMRRGEHVNQPHLSQMWSDHYQHRLPYFWSFFWQQMNTEKQETYHYPLFFFFFFYHCCYSVLFNYLLTQFKAVLEWKLLVVMTGDVTDTWSYSSPDNMLWCQRSKLKAGTWGKEPISVCLSVLHVVFYWF